MKEKPQFEIKIGEGWAVKVTYPDGNYIQSKYMPIQRLAEYIYFLGSSDFERGNNPPTQEGGKDGIRTQRRKWQGQRKKWRRRQEPQYRRMQIRGTWKRFRKGSRSRAR